MARGTGLHTLARSDAFGELVPGQFGGIREWVAGRGLLVTCDDAHFALHAPSLLSTAHPASIHANDASGKRLGSLGLIRLLLGLLLFPLLHRQQTDQIAH
jgi:hypothetical protein